MNIRLCSCLGCSRMKPNIAVSAMLCAGAVMLIAPIGQAQNLFVVDEGSSSIYEFTPNGTRSTFASGLDGPWGLAFNSAGNLFVANAGANNIYEFTPDGTRSTLASGLNYPTGLAFNSAGVLFATAASGGKIYEFMPNGGSSTFASGLSFPDALAFQPVPEPSTWALVAMGIDMFVGGLRLRRRSA